MELMLVVLRALAHCYPAVFRVWEPPPPGADVDADGFLYPIS